MPGEERLCRIALNATPFLHPVLYHRLVSAFGSARAVFRAGKGQLAGVNEISGTMAEQISQTDPVKEGERELDHARRLGADIVMIGDEGYPEPLVNTFGSPPALAIQGEWKTEDALSIAVVGTRSPTGYGKLMAEKLAEGLARAGITVVSGLARGVDGVAHRAALKAGGRTIAVLGCGLNIYYPPEHRELQRKIPGNGAVISQFSCSTSPNRTRFPLRNRVISGLCLGTLVVEAPEKSGALITAYCALEDNREVFALPGPVNSKKSVGTNNLIKNGHARLTQTVDDIIDGLPDYARQIAKTRQMALPINSPDSLTGEEKTVMMSVDEQRHIDMVVDRSGLPINRVSAILLSLEIKGFVKQLEGKFFVRN